MDQEIKLTEKNIDRIKKISKELKQQELQAKLDAKEKARRFNMEKEKHMYSLTLEYMKNKPLKTVHEQLVGEFKKGVKDDVDDYLRNPPKNLNDLKRRNFLKTHKTKAKVEKEAREGMQGSGSIE